MAGWKLRKDKAQAETPGAEAEAAVPGETAAEAMPETLPERVPKTMLDHETHPDETVFAGDVPDLPPFDSDTTANYFDTDLHFTDFAFDGDTHAPAQDDGPLTLVDYTEPGADPAATQTAAIPAEPAPASAFAEPPSEAASAEAAPDDFLDRLRADPARPAAPLPPAPGIAPFIPSVAPFVLDTPPVAVPEFPRQVVVSIGRLSAAFTLAKEVTTIGRPDSVLHYYPDIEIEMDDAVSRRHAEILKRDDGFYLVDAGSTNGTVLNGEPLPAHEERLLAHGDRIRLGDRTEIVFE